MWGIGGRQAVVGAAFVAAALQGAAWAQPGTGLTLSTAVQPSFAAGDAAGLATTWSLLRSADGRFPAAPVLSADYGLTPWRLDRTERVGLLLGLNDAARRLDYGFVPHVSLGLQLEPTAVPPHGAATWPGMRRTDGALLLSANKQFLAQGITINGSLRYARGAGAWNPADPVGSSYALRPELSIAYLVTRNLAIGAEYRFKPGTLESSGRSLAAAEAQREEDSADLYLAWAPGKGLSLTLAYVGLGRTVPGIVPSRRPSGAFLSASFAF